MSDVSKVQRWMAGVCASCPMCRYARNHKGGVVERVVKAGSRICVFCRAYEKVHGVNKKEADEVTSERVEE